MAYFGGGPNPPKDWGARDKDWKLERRVEELERQVAELLAERDEAHDTVGGAV